MAEREVGVERMCRHCGAVEGTRLGHCSVCGLTVCEHCGNLQHARGETRAVHNTCLAREDGGFSMIKFVK